MRSILENALCAPENKCILLFFDRMFNIQDVNFIWSSMSFKVTLSFIFCIDDIPINVREVLKSVIITVLISSFMSLNTWFMFWSAPMLGTQIFAIILSSCWIFPFYHHVVSLFLVTIFVLKCVLCNESIALLAFFSLPFTW